MASATKRPIHVCIVTTAHPVDDVRVNSKIAQALRSAGFRVSWVGPGHSFFDPSLAGRAGIEFVLTKPNRSRLDRLLAASRVRRRVAEVKDVDVYYAPDPDSAPVALRMAGQNGAKVIFDIHEVYHGALLSRWIFGLRLPALREHMRRRIGRVCERCDLVMGVNQPVLDPYITDAARRLVVRSCAPKWFADGPAAEVMAAGRPRFRLMHGKVSLERGTARVLEAVKLATPEVPDLQVVMLSGGPVGSDPAAQVVGTMADELGIRAALELRAGVPMKQMPEILRSCDAGLIAYGRELGVDSLPNRIFEYMATGLPVIVPQYSTEMARIVEGERCGLLADFEDPASVAAAIARLHADPEECRAMGRRGREAFVQRHNWDVEVRPMLDRIRSWFPAREDA